MEVHHVNKVSKLKPQIFSLAELKPFKYSCELILHAGRGKVFECEIKDFDGKVKFLTAVEFPTKEEALTYQRSKVKNHEFKGIMIFENEKKFYLLGNYVGVPLDKYFEQNKANLWDPQNLHLGANRSLKKPGKDIARFLTQLHEKGRFLGDLKSSTFICPKTLKITFVSLVDKKTPEWGIKEDIVQFKELIQQCDPMHLQSAYLTLFFELFPRQLPNNLEDLKQLSYRVCHAPLFWDFEERYRFACNYWKIRQNDLHAFSRQVVFDSVSTDVGPWWLKVCQRTDAFYRIYKFNPTIRKAELMSFFRNSFSRYAEEHPKVTQHEVDTKLLNLFPYAYPKAYTEVFTKYVLLSPDRTNSFKNATLPLNYGKVN